MTRKDEGAAVMQMLACSSECHIEALIRKGFPITTIDRLSLQGIDAVAVGLLSARRLRYCRQHQKCFTPEESDHLYRLCTTLIKARSVFGDQGNALTWLRRPHASFGGVSALTAVVTTPGYECVKDELERMRSGYFA